MHRPPRQWPAILERMFDFKRGQSGRVLLFTTRPGWRQWNNYEGTWFYIALVGRTIGYLTGDDDRLQTPIAILAKRQQRLVAVAKGIGKLNDLRHAAEMLAKTNTVAKAQISLVEEAVLEVKVIRQWQV